MTTEIQPINQTLNKTPVEYQPSTKKFLFCDIPEPSTKIKCLSGRVLSHWADVRTSTKDQILLSRIVFATGRFLGGLLISWKAGFVGTIWHTAAAVVQAALFVLSSLIYYSSRILCKSEAPKTEWQVRIEKFNHEMGASALHHFGSAWVDFIRAIGPGALTTGFHFAICPEDYISGQKLHWTRKPSSIDTLVTAILF